MSATDGASGSLASSAEVLKLARVLERDPDELRYLEQVPADDVRRLREQVTDMLFDADDRTLRRLAAASKLLPVGVVAIIAERAFGPVLAARLAGMLEPNRAIEVAAKLPTSYLADVAINLDPRRASRLLAGIPPRQVTAISRELAARGEYVTMGRFVGHLSDQAITASLDGVDDATLLQVGFVLEDKERLEDVVDLLRPGRLDGVIDTAAEADLWPELLDLLSYLGPPARQRIVGDGSIELDDAALDGLVDAVVARDLWDQVLTLARYMPDRELERTATRLTGHISRLDRSQREMVADRVRSLGLTGRLASVGVELP